MINDISCKDFDALFFCEFFGLLSYFYIKREQSRKFHVLTRPSSTSRFHAFKYVFLVNGADVDRTYWNLLLVQELKKSFK